jgi:hypothetical protein
MSGIYLIQADESLVEMRPTDYDSEDVLQRLIEKYPGVLAGDRFGRAAPRRWLLLAREISVPSDEGGSGRWSLDHLFVDQDATPTLVEVKRRGDTRIRREVVGQLLDYAANAVVYWPVGRLRGEFESRCTREQRNSHAELLDRLGPEVAGDPSAFWRAVDDNLRAGKIRLVFLADEIPAELARIVEFLNRQMSPADVFAVEVRQYVGQHAGQTLRTLVPQVLGQKPPEPPPLVSNRPKDATAFVGRLRDDFGETEAQIAVQVIQWATDHHLQITPAGDRVGALRIRLETEAAPVVILSLDTNGNVTFDLISLRAIPQYSDSAAVELLRNRFTQIVGTPLRAAAYPWSPIRLLEKQEVFERFRAELTKMIENACA